jgi:hypothetical protein
MYVKIFSQIYDSSIAEDYLVRLVFEDFLILADKDGYVDMTVEAIARRTNVPLDIVSQAIEKLSSPDSESRTPDEEGRRIVLLDDHRSWGWRIVNYAQYRSIRDDEARKEYFRERQREHRARTKNVTDSEGHVFDGEGQSTNVTQAEAEAVSNKKHTVSDSVVDGIYQAYPRKRAPRNAKKAIAAALKRIAPKHDAEWMLGQVRRYAETREGQDPQYTPYPATWFNRDRFDDEFPEAQRSYSSHAPKSEEPCAFAHPSRVIDFRRKAGL